MRSAIFFPKNIAWLLGLACRVETWHIHANQVSCGFESSSTLAKGSFQIIHYYTKNGLGVAPQNERLWLAVRHKFPLSRTGNLLSSENRSHDLRDLGEVDILDQQHPDQCSAKPMIPVPAASILICA
jgi:hypothetical protein